jgi:hypothetical protein
MFGQRDDQTLKAQITLPEIEAFEAELRRSGGDVRSALRRMRPDLHERAPVSVSLSWVHQHWNEWNLEINIEVDGLVLW